MSIQNNITVGDVLLGLDETPKTTGTTLLKEALEKMDQARLGIVCITGIDGMLEGIITDGDIRRMLNTVQKPIAALMSDDVINHSITNPTIVTRETKLIDAVILMGEKQIWDLPVIDQKGILVGLLHLHPAIKTILGLSK